MLWFLEINFDRTFFFALGFLKYFGVPEFAGSAFTFRVNSEQLDTKAANSTCFRKAPTLQTLFRRSTTLPTSLESHESSYCPYRDHTTPHQRFVRSRTRSGRLCHRWGEPITRMASSPDPAAHTGSLLARETNAKLSE